MLSLHAAAGSGVCGKEEKVAAKYGPADFKFIFCAAKFANVLLCPLIFARGLTVKVLEVVLLGPDPVADDEGVRPGEVGHRAGVELASWNKKRKILLTQLVICAVYAGADVLSLCLADLGHAAFLGFKWELVSARKQVTEDGRHSITPFCARPLNTCQAGVDWA